MLKGKRILLIVAGGIAAFKSLELIRRFRQRGASARCVAIEARLAPQEKPLAGGRAVWTSGPTREGMDPVRFISTHPPGKQGLAFAWALARLGADVTLVSGPVALADPPGLRTVHVDSADQ